MSLLNDKKRDTAAKSHADRETDFIGYWGDYTMKRLEANLRLFEGFLTSNNFIVLLFLTFS